MNSFAARYQDWMSLKTNLVWIYEGKPSKGIGGSMYPEYSAAWLLLKGNVQVSRENESVTARAGEWMIPWPGPRLQTFSPDAELLSIRFQCHWPDGRPLFEQGLSLAFPSRKFLEMETAARKLLSAATPFIPDDPTLLGISDLDLPSFIDVKFHLLRFVIAFSNALVSHGLKPTRLGIRDERICHAMSRLDFVPLNRKFREGDLAKESGLGLSQFTRLFREETGTTPKKYLEARKKNVCERMLATSSVPLKQIAMELGFSHPSDFSYWFKKIYKTTPKLYRSRYLRQWNEAV